MQYLQTGHEGSLTQLFPSDWIATEMHSEMQCSQNLAEEADLVNLTMLITAMQPQRRRWLGMPITLLNSLEALHVP